MHGATVRQQTIFSIIEEPLNLMAALVAFIAREEDKKGDAFVREGASPLVDDPLLEKTLSKGTKVEVIKR